MKGLFCIIAAAVVFLPLLTQALDCPEYGMAWGETIETFPLSVSLSS
jgi:hypothetical protein